MQQIAHSSIDFAAADDGRIDPASYHHGFASSSRREIAFMTDADNLVGQSESARDLGGAWKQGTDPHVLMISLTIVHLLLKPRISQPLAQPKDLDAIRCGSVMFKRSTSFPAVVPRRDCSEFQSRCCMGNMSITHA